MLKSIGLANDTKKKDEKTLEESSSSTSSLATSEDLAEAVRLAPYVDIIRKNFGVEPVRESRATIKDTRLIEISYKHTDPELAANIVNGIASVFTKQNQEKRTGTSKKTNDFLDERIADLQSQIKADEIKLVELKDRSGIIEVDKETTIVIERLQGLNKQLLDAENQRKNAEANYNAIKDSPDKQKSLAEAEIIRYTTESESNMRALRIKTTESDFTAQNRKGKGFTGILADIR